MEYWLTNQSTRVWAHYTGTLQGARTDQMVEFFQTILIR